MTPPPPDYSESDSDLENPPPLEEYIVPPYEETQSFPEPPPMSDMDIEQMSRKRGREIETQTERGKSRRSDTGKQKEYVSELEQEISKAKTNVAKLSLLAQAKEATGPYTAKDIDIAFALFAAWNRFLNSGTVVENESLPIKELARWQMHEPQKKKWRDFLERYFARPGAVMRKGMFFVWWRRMFDNAAED